MGRGMVGQPTWEQERPHPEGTRPPAVRRLGEPTQDVDREQPAAVRRGSGERESERFIVLMIPRQQKRGGGKEPYFVHVQEGGRRW